MPGDSQSTPPIRARKLLLFRLLAAALLPLLLLLLAEAGLRLAGFGHPTGFYLKAKIENQPAFIDNYRFGLRFFPESLLRSPKPDRIPVEKGKEVIRVVVLGESAAYGDPEPAFGFWRQLEVLLNERFPFQKFQVICAAMTAINSHTIREIARDVSALNADYWILYMGNNEMIGPYGAGTVFSPQAPGMAFIRANLALKRLRLGQLAESLLVPKPASPRPEGWGGLKMFERNQIAPNAPARGVVLDHFKANLQAILAEGAAAGAKVILSTVPVNLRDCGPFASGHGPGYAANAQAWDDAYANAKKLLQSKVFDAALAEFQKAAEIDPDHAELRFLLGQTHLLLQEPDKAMGHLRAACDLDALPFRATTPINQAIRAAAPNAPGAVLVDNDALFQDQSPLKVAGQEFFFEHVHLTFPGNYLLSVVFAEAVMKHLPPGIRDRALPVWPTRDEVAKRLAHTVWDDLQIAESIQGRIVDAPYTNRINNPNQVVYLNAQIKSLRDKLGLEQLSKDEESYRATLAKRPGDPHLHVNFARFLEGRDQLEAAAEQWRAVESIWPHQPMGAYYQGRILNLRGDPAAAEVKLRQAIALRPGLQEAIGELGACLVRLKKAEEGMVYLDRALQRQPNSPELNLNRAEAFEALGKTNEMRQAYVQAAKLKPALVSAKLLQGKALKEKGDVEAALAAFRQADMMKPQDPLVSYALADAFAALGRRPEALAALRLATTAQPDFWEARYLYGVELAVDNKMAEAAAEFEAVLAANPAFIRAHLNLGVCQVKLGKLAEARASFDHALDIDPSNEQARQYITALEKLRSRPSQPAPLGPLRPPE